MNTVGKITVVKIGGAIIDDRERLDAFLKDFSTLSGNKILIHGGGREGSRISRKLGIEPEMIDGRRVTSQETLEVVTMVYAGSVNKRIVALLQKHGAVGATGFCGADANLMCARRRGPLNGIDYGMVGDLKPEGVNKAFLITLVGEGYIPVLSPITHDGNGQLLNTNADTIAASVASALASAGCDVELVYCFEQDGVMTADGVLIPGITADSFEALKDDGTVSGGMIPKLDNALAVARSGASVRIKRAEALTDPDAGSLIGL